MFLHILVADVEIFMKNVSPLVTEFSVCFSDVSEFSSMFNLALHVALCLGLWMTSNCSRLMLYFHQNDVQLQQILV